MNLKQSKIQYTWMFRKVQIKFPNNLKLPYKKINKINLKQIQININSILIFNPKDYSNNQVINKAITPISLS